MKPEGISKYETKETRPGEKALTINDQKLLPTITWRRLVHDYETIATQLTMAPNTGGERITSLPIKDRIERLQLKPKGRKGVTRREKE